MLNRVDAHCHLWTVARGDYGWLDPSNPALTPIARDFGMDDLHTADSTCTARIVVQAAPTVAETEFLLGLAKLHADIAGVVGWVDLSRNDAAPILEQLARNPAFKGVRPMLQDIPETDWITTQPRAGAIAKLIEHDLTFDALVLPQHLAALLEFSTKHPDLSIVIDHAAKPALAAVPDDPRHALWRDGMARLAAETNACCKISGLLTELAPEQYPRAGEILRPVIHDLLAWFGPDRLMWGSDWPVVNLAASFGAWTKLSAELFSTVEQADLTKIYSGTAQQFYNMGEAA